MWPGAQPKSKDEFDQTYFDVLRGMIQMMKKYNIWALLDCHQDVLSEKYCGEGVPDWAATGPENFPNPVDSVYPIDPSTGYPYEKDCNKSFWPDYYFALATCVAFQNLYSNVNGLADDFANFWKMVAMQYKDLPNIIGYELLNEPFAGDIYAHPSYLEPRTADYENLQPLYNRINAAIRQIDDEHLVLFEPVTWADYGCGFDSVPGGLAYQNRSALSYHFYIPPNVNIYDTMILREGDMKLLGCGGFLTEFDVGTSSDTAQAIETLESMDLHKQSWTGWEYKPFVPITGWGWGFFNPNGSIDDIIVKTFSRTYAYAIAGTVQSTYFDWKTSQFYLQYTIKPSCTLPTEIYLSEKLYYPRGFNITISPANVASWSRLEPRNYIQITHLVKQSIPVAIHIVAI